VLAAGTFSTASISALVIGLPVLVPTLRDEYSLSLGEIGVLLASEWVGTTLALLPWGLAADRFGERIVMSVGLTASAVFIVGAAFAESFGALLALLALAGAAGAAVNSSSGRAVMHWFDADERGLALGVRQTAIPIGGFVGALALPPIAASGGSEDAFLFLAALCVVGALVGGLVLRERKHDEDDELEVASLVATLRDRRLWRLSLGSGLYLYAQLAVLGFAVVFLHDEHGLSESRAALAVAASQVLAMGLRIGVGRWSGRSFASASRSRSSSLRRPFSHAARSGCSCRPSRSRAGSRWPGTDSPSRPQPSSPAGCVVARRSACNRRCSAAPESPLP
jgi:nitrate/nitrite transporter NarK